MIEQNTTGAETTNVVIKNKKKSRFCRQCGKLKHNICFEHHTFPKSRIRDVVPMRLYYYLKKFYFRFARILKFVE